jgi:hypothetical protein
MSDRVSEYKTSNTQIKLLFCVPLKIDKKQVDSVSKQILKFHSLKKNNKIYCDITKEDMKYVSESHIESLSEHIYVIAKFVVKNFIFLM